MFKKGDTVICENNRNNETVLTVGNEYMVVDVQQDGVYIVVLNDEGHRHAVYSTRFVRKTYPEKKIQRDFALSSQELKKAFENKRFIKK
jgi:hypothetical protein